MIPSIARAKAVFGQAIRPPPAPDQRLTFMTKSLAAEALTKPPGWLDAVLASANPAFEGAVQIQQSTLDTINRRFAPGCCGH